MVALIYLIISILIVYFLLKKESEDHFSNNRHGLQSYNSNRYRTNRGEIVKSKGELKIANFLNHQNVCYEYEKPLILDNGARVLPDFYLPRYNLYIEFFGMLGIKKYNNNIALKKRSFQRNNIKYIELYPNNYNNMGYILKKRFEDVTNIKFPGTKKIYYN